MITSQSVYILSIELFIRRYHAYMDVWTTVQGEILRLIPECTNYVNSNAVAVMKGRIVI